MSNRLVRRNWPCCLTELESRTLPIVGAYVTPIALSPELPQYDRYNGVVALEVTRSENGVPFTDKASGALVGGGNGEADLPPYNILTAAHVVRGVREGGMIAVGTAKFDLSRDGKVVQVNVPFRSEGITRSPWYTGTRETTDPDDDIGVIRLTGPDNPNGVAVRPFTAKSYPLYSGSQEVGAVTTMVGYGYRGDGASPAVFHNANGQIVEGLIDGRKRLTRNKIERSNVGSIIGTGPYIYDYPRHLAVDFDSGDAKNDVFGEIYGIAETGGGDTEGLAIDGDSGGPWFTTVNGTEYLTAVTAGYFSGGPRYDPDNNANGTFGEVGIGTRVGAHHAPLLNSALRPRDGYDLILDMGYQVYGNSKAGEDIHIEVGKSLSTLTIKVTGSDKSLNGVYYTDSYAKINSLTIIGSSDNETVTLAAGVGLPNQYFLPGGIRFNGEGGNDKLIWDYESDNVDGVEYLLVRAPATGDPETQWDSRLVRRYTRTDGTVYLLPPVDSKEIEGYALKTGSGADVIRVEKVPAGYGLTVDARGGDDTVYVGSDAEGLGGQLPGDRQHRRRPGAGHFRRAAGGGVRHPGRGQVRDHLRRRGRERCDAVQAHPAVPPAAPRGRPGRDLHHRPVSQ